MIKINNFIFVHGGIVNEPYSWYDNINTQINAYDKNEQYIGKIFNDLNISVNSDNIATTSPVWSRFMGDPDIRKQRHTEETKNNPTETNNFCQSVRNLFNKFNNDAPEPKTKIQDLKVVIGHSVQYSLQIVDKVFSKLIEKNANTITFEHVKDVRFDRIDKENNYNFNLTTECNNNADYNEIFRVDAGTSRAMDLVKKISTADSKTIKAHLNYLTNLVIIAPQVLKIVFADNADTKIYLIRATDSRTRTHVPRPWWEEKLKDYYDNIKQKYLKYKTKYLKLKNNV